MANQITTNKVQFSQFIKSPAVINSIEKTLGSAGKRATFVTAIVSAVNATPTLQNCDFQSIVSSALVGESLNLSPSPQLGQYYLMPFKDKASFVLGYKGMIQLAVRSGQYRKLNVISVKAGELVGYDPFNEEIKLDLIADPMEREKAETTGYYAMFELTNGFRKSMYWSKEQMEAHALRYSQGYKAKKGYTFWEKDFDAMAQKTMLRQLLSKWGIMSIEMQMAYTKDNTYQDSNGNDVYYDSADTVEAVHDDVRKQAIEAQANVVQVEMQAPQKQQKAPVKAKPQPVPAETYEVFENEPNW